MERVSQSFLFKEKYNAETNHPAAGRFNDSDIGSGPNEFGFCSRRAQVDSILVA